MEQPITAHKAGTVTGLSAEVGAAVTSGAVICTIADAADDPRGAVAPGRAQRTRSADLRTRRTTTSIPAASSAPAAAIATRRCCGCPPPPAAAPGSPSHRELGLRRGGDRVGGGRGRSGGRACRGAAGAEPASTWPAPSAAGAGAGVAAVGGRRRDDADHGAGAVMPCSSTVNSPPASDTGTPTGSADLQVAVPAGRGRRGAVEQQRRVGEPSRRGARARRSRARSGCPTRTARRPAPSPRGTPASSSAPAASVSRRPRTPVRPDSGARVAVPAGP